MKCPNCGAPMRGDVCSYCGSAGEPAAPAPVLTPERGENSDSRGKRNVLDLILITLGGLWCLIVVAVIIELNYWSPVELTAALLLAAPGIVLLLIGFRRKKTKK